MRVKFFFEEYYFDLLVENILYIDWEQGRHNLRGFSIESFPDFEV